MKKKLVRDNVPDIIRESGYFPVFEIATNYESALIAKLREETDALEESMYRKDYIIEELSDILEVVRAIAIDNNITFDELGKALNEKYEKKGGFQRKFVLSSIAHE